jgi:hypothetical protein
VVGLNSNTGGPGRGPGDLLPGVTHTTGILIYSTVAPIERTLVSGNHISEGVHRGLVDSRQLAILRPPAELPAVVRIGRAASG